MSKPENHEIVDVQAAGLDCFGLCSCGHREMTRALPDCWAAMRAHVAEASAAK